MTAPIGPIVPGAKSSFNAPICLSSIASTHVRFYQRLGYEFDNVVLMGKRLSAAVDGLAGWLGGRRA